MYYVYADGHTGAISLAILGVIFDTTRKFYPSGLVGMRTILATGDETLPLRTNRCTVARSKRPPPATDGLLILPFFTYIIPPRTIWFGILTDLLFYSKLN